MPGSAWLNIEEIKHRIRQGEFDALEEIGDKLATDARRRAPIRKVFKEDKGFRRKFRRLTAAEQQLAIARANRFYTTVHPNEFKRRRSVAHIRNYATVQIARRGSANSLGRSNALRTLGYERHGKFIAASPGARRLIGRNVHGGGFEPGENLKGRLTSRGAYEIRSGRAIHREATVSGHTRVRIGGALKASIGSLGATETGSGMKVTVEAAIRYAKFVEFPTIHNAAQPFMRPALHALRAAIPRIVGSHIAAAMRR